MRRRRAYHYWVRKDLGFADPVEFRITLWARDDRAAQIQAAEIGLQLGLLLVGG
jgi:hypothetical protein